MQREQAAEVEVEEEEAIIIIIISDDIRATLVDYVLNHGLNHYEGSWAESPP